MKKVPFEGPKDKYNEQLYPIDEQICSLLKERKELSNNPPGSPPDEAISKWAEKYGFYEDYLKSIFGTIRMEHFFKTRVEPAGFRKHIPVLKSIEVGERLFSVTVIKQYENSSVVQLHIDWDEPKDLPRDQIHKFLMPFLELILEKPYETRQEGGGGSSGHYTYSFVVAPPLPDDISGLDLVFKEYHDHCKEKPTGLEFVVNVE